MTILEIVLAVILGALVLLWFIGKLLDASGLGNN